MSRAKEIYRALTHQKLDLVCSRKFRTCGL